MLLKTDIALKCSLLMLSLILLAHYVQHNEKSIFFWRELPCNHEKECLQTYFAGAISPKNKDLLDLIRYEYLVPPPENYSTAEFSIYTPIWRKLVDWDEMQEDLKDVWQNQPPGFFVEVGAVDGIFMSETIYLERNLSWTGFLIEPDPRSFKMLQQAQRNAWLANICVYSYGVGKKVFWLRNMDEDLPFHFQQILLARSKMNEETMVGDEDRGTLILQFCAPLSTLLMAGNFRTVDMLSIATGYDSDERRITETLNKKDLDIKTLLIQYPASKFFEVRYPAVRGYILDMSHSQLLIKFYVKKEHCLFVQRGNCKKMKYYDVIDGCIQYFCLNHLNVWTYDEEHLRNITKGKIISY